ncbi:MAG: MerR family transcriptional regulator [Bacteroidales bacterium]|nr:MerR family transcriptional regulator [Bacteroidales bacterium]MBQ9311068.1 MerR family transcriptional regulator [Bacteroidales bacterium]
MEKLYYTIGETASQLGENVSLVRYWTTVFGKFLKPSRTTKGDRRYTAEDIATLKQIHYLVKDKGLTLEGAARQLKDDKSSVDKRVKALESLKDIRTQLMEIRKAL